MSRAKNTLFTFLPVCVILSVTVVIAFLLSGCLEKDVPMDEKYFFSFKVDCPQCNGLKSVKTENGTLAECAYCDGLGFVYQNPQGNYKTSQ